MFAEHNLTNDISRDCYLLPYCNVEDLCRDPSHLLGLIHHRGYITPDKFSYLDFDLMHCGIYFQKIHRPFVNLCSMKLYGGRNEYGQLIEWSDELPHGLTGWDLQEQEVAYAPADALVLFEAQSKLLSFLLNIIKNLMEPIVINLLEPVENPLPPPDLRTTQSRQKFPSKEWTSVAETHALAPFSAPPKYDLNEIRQIVRAKLAETQDHLWLLQTDPAYFHQSLTEYDSHRIERVRNNSQNINTEFIYDSVVGDVVGEAVDNVITWGHLERQLTQVEKTYMANQHEITAGMPLPKEYEEALSIFDLINVWRKDLLPMWWSCG